MRIIKSNKLANPDKMTILVIDDSLATAGSPEWTVFELNPSIVDPQELAATSLGFATDKSYDSFFKQGVKILDSSEEYDDAEIYDMYEEIEETSGKHAEFDDLMDYLGWGSVNNTYTLTKLGKIYD